MSSSTGVGEAITGIYKAPAATSYLVRVAHGLTSITIAWGALAFGAVYPWALWTMAGLAVGAGLCGVGATLGNMTGVPTSRFLLASFLLIITVVALQLIPLPLNALATVNGNGIALLERLNTGFAYAPQPHAISVSPSMTFLALALLIALFIMLIGTMSMISMVGAKRIVETVILVGVIVALIAIVQKPLYNGKIYGFWATEQVGNPFGPFVNKNHFAGWMVMAIPVALGYLCSGLARGLHGVRPDWHGRIVWFSSKAASKLVMTALGVAVMALALLLSLSRSGITALMLAIAITSWFALRRLSGSRKLLATTYLLILTALTVTWAGVDTLAKRFAEPNWTDLNGRIGAWTDAMTTFQRHWLTGTGLNTYQVVNIVYQQHDKESFVSAAHNDFLQVAAEGGLLLTVPILACVAAFIREVRRRFKEDGPSTYWLRAGAVTALTAISFQETVDFSLQMPGNAALFAVVCAIALHRPRRRAFA